VALSAPIDRSNARRNATGFAAMVRKRRHCVSGRQEPAAVGGQVASRQVVRRLLSGLALIIRAPMARSSSRTPICRCRTAGEIDLDHDVGVPADVLGYCCRRGLPPWCPLALRVMTLDASSEAASLVSSKAGGRGTGSGRSGGRWLPDWRCRGRRARFRCTNGIPALELVGYLGRGGAARCSSGFPASPLLGRVTETRSCRLP
jgi:hypothetical protein